jgi:hypothetical protein
MIHPTQLGEPCVHYKAFVRSYYRWYNRMAVGDGPNYLPCLFLSTLQAVNLVCLFGLLLPRSIPRWVVMTGAALVVLVMYGCNRAIIDAIEEAPRFSRWSDNVPGFREYPAVYAYLAFSLALLFLPAIFNSSG